MTTPDLVKLARECGARVIRSLVGEPPNFIFSESCLAALASRIASQSIDDAAKSIDDTSILRRALLAIKFSAPSLADAQVIALRALNQFEPEEAVPWANCETRAPWVRNGLKARIAELRAAEKRCRKAYSKPFMGEPCAYVADAYAEAAEVFERRLSRIPRSPPHSDAIKEPQHG